jgi:hypothetical protein
MTEVPEQMKQDNWALFVLARSHDPAVKVPYTRELVSSLISTMGIAGERQYDELLTKCKIESSDAFRVYDEEKNWARAMVIAVNVLDQLGFLLYNDKWAISKSDSFRFPVRDTAQEGERR